jgi:hypothetical protein
MVERGLEGADPLKLPLSDGHYMVERGLKGEQTPSNSPFQTATIW